MFSDIKPRAFAHVRGGPLRPEITGTVWFLTAPEGGTYVAAEIKGLPPPIARHRHRGRLSDLSGSTFMKDPAAL